MIALSEKFSRDIENSHITIYPFIIIGAEKNYNSNGYLTGFTGEDSLRISTVKEVIPFSSDSLYNTDDSSFEEDASNYFYKDFAWAYNKFICLVDGEYNIDFYSRGAVAR